MQVVVINCYDSHAGGVVLVLGHHGENGPQRLPGGPGSPQDGNRASSCDWMPPGDAGFIVTAVSLSRKKTQMCFPVSADTWLLKFLFIR